MKKVKQFLPIVLMVVGMFVLGACGGSNTTATAPISTTAQNVVPASTSTEQPITPITSSQVVSSDIPDTQTFVTYSSALGRYQLDVPEGWARTTQNANVSFVFNLDGLQVSIAKAPVAPTVASVTATQAVTLQQTGRAVRDVKVQDVQLPNGAAVLMSYTSNSEPDSVTGKQVRQENNSYLFYKNGMVATLTLWAPVGADNVDQWARISRSFKWV